MLWDCLIFQGRAVRGSALFLLLGLNPFQVFLIDIRLDIAAVKAAVTVGIAVEQHFVFVGLVANRPGTLNFTGVDIRAAAFRTFIVLHGNLTFLRYCLGDGLSLAPG